MHTTTGLGGDFVRSVLDKFEQLSVTVSALRDPPFAIRVFRDEPRIDGVRLENAGGLLDHRFQDGLQLGRHITPILECRPRSTRDGETARPIGYLVCCNVSYREGCG
ncbi:hypothetical protein NC490_31555 [Streptomyces sp. G1]|nr:hypothetical protein [Streptomyces sp. G1]MCM1970848.1 hypothetical protein [Streptomyces sp. G1]